MTGLAGQAVDAMRAGSGRRQRRLGTRPSTEADQVLAEVLAGAHGAMREGVRRLDAIAAEIDSAVKNQAALAVDTPIGAREFRKFLIAKQREISAVVSQHASSTREKGRAGRAAGEVHFTRRLAPASCAAVPTGELSPPTRPGYRGQHGGEHSNDSA